MVKIITYSARERRKKRVAFKFVEKTEKPQLRVFRSNKRIYAQVIDRKKNVILASESDLKINTKKKMAKKERAKEVGLKLAKKLLKLNIKQLIFNRGHYQYAGRVKALVEGVKEQGVKI